MHVRAELIERQEEQVVGRPEGHRDHGAETRQQLTVDGGIVRAADTGTQGGVRLAGRGQYAVHAEAHAADLQIRRHRRLGIEADELRLVEEVAEVVVLTRLEQDVRLRYARQGADAEQQVVLLANAGREVLLDLRRGERAVVDGDELDDALPLALTGGLVAEHQREAAVPVGERAALGRIRIAAIDAVDVDLLP